MENPILYVILNKELNMSAGKAAAQTAHAVALLGAFNNKFIEPYRRTVIVLEAENEAQIRSLNEYLFNVGLSSYYYLDEGENEVPAYSLTAMAVEPFEADNESLREIFAPFDLFSGQVPDYFKLSDTEVASRYLKWAFPSKYDRPWFVRKTIKWLNKQ